jgi:uncharacterized protein (DUF433 family)
MNREEIEKHITTDPLVLRGVPIVRGTRVPVYVIMDFVAEGYSPEEIVDDFPDITVKDVEAAIAYNELLLASIEVRPLHKSA